MVKFTDYRAQRWMEKNTVTIDGTDWFVTPTEHLFEQAVVGVMQYKSVEEFVECTGVEFLDILDKGWDTCGLPSRVFTVELPE